MRRVATVLTAALGLTMLTSVAPSETASAAPSDVVAIVIEGTGNGHGRGMSQWGAYGWAVDEGKDWTWILDHYYGGTALGDVNTAQARIRVRLTALDGLGTVGVTSSSGGVQWGGQTQASMYAKEISPNTFQVFGSSSRACPTSSTLVVPDGPISQGSNDDTAVRQIQTFLNTFQIPGDATLTVDGDFGNLTRARLEDWQRDQALPSNGIWDKDDADRARQLISASSGTATWTLLDTKPGPIVFATANGENSAAAPADVLGVCNSSGKVTHYRGKIEVRSESVGNRVVNDVKTEDYLRGVVPKEISASWADAGAGKGVHVVRAQAVAARSYGLQQNRYSYASICDTQSCQVYGGAATRSTALAGAVNVEDSRTDAGIVATAGKVRKWPNGSIVSTEFSASNGPRTAGGAFPPVDDTAGDDTAKNPNHRWTRIIDADTLTSKYGLGSLTAASMVEAASATYQKYDGIWFNDIVLTGTSGTKRMQAWDFRGAHGLPSPGFTVRVITEDTTGRSFGMVGDSIGHGIAGSASSEFQVLTDGTFASSTIDVYISRCTTKTVCAGTSGVEAASKLPMALDLVVVELGYNDSPSGFAADIDAMMNALRARDVRRVAWVNLADIRTSGGASYYAQSNAALLAAAGRWPNLTILDWDAASQTPERSRWFASDGVHLTTTGEAQFSLWLRGQILTILPRNPFLRVVPSVPLRLRVAGAGGVPVSGVSAVALNVTAVDPDGWGYLTVWPCGSPRPEASNVNYLGRGAVEPNSVLVPVDSTGEVCVYSYAAADVLVDVAGWFSSGFEPVVPNRIVDTRSGIGAAASRVVPSVPLRFRVAGAGGVPVSGVSAVALNVTAVDPDGWGFLTVWPCGSPRPEASNVNYLGRGAVEPNSVLVPVDSTGEVCVYSYAAADVLVDVAGWFSSGFEPVVPNRIVDTRSGIGPSSDS